MRAGFIFSEATTGLKRNITMTVAMILTSAISLAIFGSGLLVLIMTNKTEEIFLDKVEVRANLVDSIGFSDKYCRKDICTNLKKEIESMDGVESVVYLTPEDAFNNAKKSFEDNRQISEVLEADMFSSAFIIRVPDSEKMNKVISELSKNSAVYEVVDQRDLVDKIFNFLKNAKNIAFLLAALQAIVVIMLMANTVHVSALMRKTEISIMRLVGATRWYTQLPFIIETIFAAFVGSIIAGISLLLGKKFFFDNILENFYNSHIIAKISYTDILLVVPYLFIIGTIVAIITSYISLRSFIRD